MKKTVLITGCAGYIGSRLCQRLSDRYNVVGVDNLYYGQGPLVYSSVLQNIAFYNIDATVMDDTFKTVVRKADIVIPLAALVGMPLCEKEPELATAVNLKAIEDLVSLLKPHQQVIFPNTNSGYGKAKGIICTEETPLKAISHYGQLKDDAEKVVRTHPNSICFRLATVFGYSPRPRLDLLVNTLVYEAVIHKNIKIFDDSFLRNYIHIDDICSAFMYAMVHPGEMKGQVYNLGNDDLNMSKGKLAEKIRDYFHGACSLEKINKTDPDQRDYIVASQKLYGLGWKPSFSLENGIQDLTRFYSVLPKDEALLKVMRNA